MVDMVFSVILFEQAMPQHIWHRICNEDHQEDHVGDMLAFGIRASESELPTLYDIRPLDLPSAQLSCY